MRGCGGGDGCLWLKPFSRYGTPGEWGRGDRIRHRWRDWSLQEGTGREFREGARVSPTHHPRPACTSWRWRGRGGSFRPKLGGLGGGEKDPAPSREGAGPVDPRLMANSCRSPRRPSRQAQAQPGRTPGRLPAAWGMAAEEGEGGQCGEGAEPGGKQRQKGGHRQGRGGRGEPGQGRRAGHEESMGVLGGIDEGMGS